MATRGKYYHFGLAPWDDKRWPNFDRDERGVACTCCGEFFYDEEYFDALQLTRNIVGVPININSGHRCPRHNAKVSNEKDAKTSQHLEIAFDLSLTRFSKSPHVLLAAVITAGFTSIGLAKTFIHVDKRPGRFWTYGEESEAFWSEYVNLDFVRRVVQGHKFKKWGSNGE